MDFFSIVQNRFKKVKLILEKMVIRKLQEIQKKFSDKSCFFSQRICLFI